MTFTLIVATAVILSASFPMLRWLTGGIDIGPAAGIYFAACGLALWIVVRTPSPRP